MSDGFPLRIRRIRILFLSARNPQTEARTIGAAEVQSILH